MTTRWHPEKRGPRFLQPNRKKRIAPDPSREEIEPALEEWLAQHGEVPKVRREETIEAIKQRYGKK